MIAPEPGGSHYREDLDKAEGALINVIEKKVTAASTASTLTTVAVAAVGLYVFHGIVPDWVTVVIEAAVTGGLTFVAGYWAKHTHRTITPPPPIDPPAVNRAG